MASDAPHPEAQPTLRVDLHAHTRWSWDGIMSPRTLVERAAAVGLDRIAVTDHNEIEGALRARDLAPGRVIVGEEVRCRDGSELIALFIEERIPPRLPVDEVAERIRAQGGIVYAPHPYAYLRRTAEHAERVLAAADICEAFNSRAFLSRWNRRARAEGLARGLRLAASSDAHLPHEIGRAWTEMAPFTTTDEFLAAAANGALHDRGSGTIASHLITLGAGAFQLLLRHGLRRDGSDAPPQPVVPAAAGLEE